MKKIIKFLRKGFTFIFGIVFIIPLCTSGQSIYSEPLKDIDGNSINLQQYQGKRLVFIILPVQEDTLALAIKTFAAGLDSSVQIVGILSEEDEYTPDKKSLIKTIYSNNNLLLTEGMKTRKGNNQSSLMQWLTDRTKNLHFQTDVQGVGHKFFINRQGVLHAVLDPRVRLISPIINRILTN